MLSWPLLAVPAAVLAQTPNVERYAPTHVAAASMSDEVRAKAVQASRARAAARAAEYAEMIESAAARTSVPADLIRAVILAQSVYNPRAETPRGARGLMPLTPETASMLGVGDVFEPEQNLDAGARHLRSMLERFGGDLPLALTAYGAGELAAAQYGVNVPDGEIRNYVTRVLRTYRNSDPRRARAEPVAGRRPAPARADLDRGQRSELWRYAEDERTVVYTNIERPGADAR
jgi:soluble lytic murein transglycosylase-like protein